MEIDENDENIYVINSIEDLVVFASDVTNGNTYEEKTINLGLSLDFNSVKSYVAPYRTDYAEYGYDGELKTALTTNIGFIPIGQLEKADDGNYFKGTFDGNNNQILGLYMNNNLTDAYKYGLFSYNYGTIKNLCIKDVNIKITGIDDTYMFVGAVSGANYGAIENVVVDGSMSLNANYGLIAGISGGNYATISNCQNYANITGTSMYMAGITGQNNNGTISRCCNNGNLESDPYIRYFGGITGLGVTGGSISECYNNRYIICKCGCSSESRSSRSRRNMSVKW